MELSRLDAHNRRWGGFFNEAVEIYLFFSDITEVRFLPEGLLFEDGVIRGSVAGAEPETYLITVVASSELVACELWVVPKLPIGFVPLASSAALDVGEHSGAARFDGYALQPTAIQVSPLDNEEIELGGDLNYLSITRTITDLRLIGLLPPGFVWDENTWSFRGRVVESGYWTTTVRVFYRDAKISTNAFGGAVFVSEGSYDKTLAFVVREASEIPQGQRTLFGEEASQFGAFRGNPDTDFHPDNRGLRLIAGDRLDLRLMFRSVTLEPGESWPEGLTFIERENADWDRLVGVLPVGEWRIKIQEDLADPLKGHTRHELGIKTFPPELRPQIPPEEQVLEVRLGYLLDPPTYEIWADIPARITVAEPTLAEIAQVNRVSKIGSNTYYHNEWKNAGWNNSEAPPVGWMLGGFLLMFSTGNSATEAAFSNAMSGIQTAYSNAGIELDTYLQDGGSIKMFLWFIKVSWNKVHSPHPVSFSAHAPEITSQTLTWLTEQQTLSLLEGMSPENSFTVSEDPVVFSAGNHHGVARVDTTATWTIRTPLPPLANNGYLTPASYWQTQAWGTHFINPTPFPRWGGVRSLQSTNSGYVPAVSGPPQLIVPHAQEAFAGTQLEGKLGAWLGVEREYFYRDETTAHNVPHTGAGAFKLVVSPFPYTTLPSMSLADSEIVRITPASPLDYDPISFDCFRLYNSCELQPQLLPHAVGGAFVGFVAEETARPAKLTRETLMDLVWNTTELRLEGSFLLWVRGYSNSSGIEEQIDIDISFDMFEVRNHASLPDSLPGVDTPYRDAWTYIKETEEVFERTIVTTLQIFGDNNTLVGQRTRKYGASEFAPLFSFTCRIEAQDGSFYTIRTRPTDTSLPFGLTMGDAIIPLYLEGEGLIREGYARLIGVGDAYEPCLLTIVEEEDDPEDPDPDPEDLYTTVTFNFDKFTLADSWLFLKDAKTLGEERVTLYAANNTITGTFATGQTEWFWKTGGVIPTIDERHTISGYATLQTDGIYQSVGTGLHTGLVFYMYGTFDPFGDVFADRLNQLQYKGKVYAVADKVGFYQDPPGFTPHAKNTYIKYNGIVFPFSSTNPDYITWEGPTDLYPLRKIIHDRSHLVSKLTALLPVNGPLHGKVTGDSITIAFKPMAGAVLPARLVSGAGTYLFTEAEIDNSFHIWS